MCMGVLTQHALEGPRHGHRHLTPRTKVGTSMWLGKAWEGALTQGAAGVGGDVAQANGRDSSKQRQNKKKKKKLTGCGWDVDTAVRGWDEGLTQWVGCQQRWGVYKEWGVDEGWGCSIERWGQ